MMRFFANFDKNVPSQMFDRILNTPFFAKDVHVGKIKIHIKIKQGLSVRVRIRG